MSTKHIPPVDCVEQSLETLPTERLSRKNTEPDRVLSKGLHLLKEF